VVVFTCPTIAIRIITIITRTVIPHIIIIITVMALTLIRTGHLFIRIYISVLVSMEDMEGMAEGGDQEGILSLTLSPSLKKIPKLARLAGKVA